MPVQTSTLEQWQRCHDDDAAREELNPHIRDSWARSIAYKVDYENAQPRPVPPADLARIKRATKRLYIYASSIILPTNLQRFNEQAGVLLFDKTGCLLRLFGSDEFKGWIEAHHIRVGCRWSEQTIGTNAVSLGTHLERVATVKGEENFARCLTFADLTYAPIKLENGDHLGGIAIACPAGMPFDNAHALALMLARAIELQLFWFEAVFVFGSVTEGSGIICLDQSNGENRILLISEESLKILGLPKRDYFYEKMESLIDPPPANKSFWDIIRNKARVVDKTLTLQVKDQDVVVSLSSSPYKEEKFHMQGISVNLNSLKRINKIVSKYSGNAARYHFDGIIGSSEPMQDVVRRAKTISLTDSNVLLQGESGVGKDVVAQAIHNNSARRSKPFVAINCAAFSKELITSELFGYESGAFTGAKREGAMGKFELANNGTLFLDEIGDMPLDLQAIMLRVVEEKSFRRVGGNELIHVNVRIIAATNQPLQHKIDQGLFREDLYYRLGTLRLTIPPLRRRGNDILQLAAYFVPQICQRLGKPNIQFTPAAQTFLLQYRWPGNVRELQNMLEGIISTHDLPVIDAPIIRDFLGESDGAPGAEEAADAGFLNSDGRFITQKDIEQALQHCHGNRARAAAYLSIGRSTLYKWMHNFGM